MSSQVQQLLLAAKAASGLSAREIARKAGLSHGTVSNALNASPRRHAIPDETLAKLARGFEIPLPQLQRAAEADRALRLVPEQATVDVRGAILADDSLLPEARAHLLNQYELLLRLNPPAPGEAVEQERRRQIAGVEQAQREVIRAIKKTAPVPAAKRPRKG